MGRFVNPDETAFQVALNSEIYVDKTKLLTYTNKVIATNQALICNSRPRRFGKSITANMLVAYYSKGAKAQALFQGLAIAQDESFAKHLNSYNVIYIDLQWCLLDAGKAANTISYINSHIISELQELYPAIPLQDVVNTYTALMRINVETKQKFIIIIDEWDVLIRDEATNKAVQDEYIMFLHGLFKGSEPTKFLALAYLTGILPIKKYNTQSALNNFDELTMINPGALAPYIGFTASEVSSLCVKYHCDFAQMQQWYDGYKLSVYHTYNPRAVVSAILQGSCQSYWSQTGTYETVVPLINMNFDGLKNAIITMLSGEGVQAVTTTYQNDMVTFKSKDDVLTLLIHLGYLAYDLASGVAYIPNEEIRTEFLNAIRETRWNEFITFQQLSDDILDATLEQNEQQLAQLLEQLHTDYASAIAYNSENSLAAVLAIAYLNTMQYYFKPIREMPLGRGFADFVYIPKPQYRQAYPALLIEFKWNKNADTAIKQIKEKKYPASLQSYANDILLVGINYDKKTKQHSCRIEAFAK